MCQPRTRHPSWDATVLWHASWGCYTFAPVPAILDMQEAEIRRQVLTVVLYRSCRALGHAHVSPGGHCIL